MQLAQRDKELAAIGAAIGCNCRPCLEHHIPAGREAGLSESALADAVATARGVRNDAIRRLDPRIDELVTGRVRHELPAPLVETSRAHALVAVGASIGANSHPLLQSQIRTAFAVGLKAAEVATAVRTAESVQRRASEMTAEKATRTLDELRAAVEAAVQADDVAHGSVPHDREEVGS